MSIGALLATIPAGGGGRMPVIFNGREPRFLGYAHTHNQADALAIAAHVSAFYVSRATTKLPDGRDSDPFFILHNGVRS